jgi:hypothetical protein
MNNITVTVELCAEDRARLDKIFEALTTNVAGYVVSQAEKYYTEKQTAVAAPVTTEAVEETQPTVDTTEPEKPAEAQETAKEEPSVSKADIQRKVVELSSAGKKAEVRDIVKAYADKVSTIPEDKLSEVWAKLTALEG